MLRGAIYGLTAAAIWGGMYVVSDVVLKIIPPFTLLTIRLLLGLAGIGFIYSRTQGLTLPRGRQLVLLLAVGALGYGISVGAQFVGTDLSTDVNGALITSAAPAFILIFAAMILKERLTMQRILAVTLATIGVVIIIDPVQADFSSDAFAGNIALAVAAITWGLFSVLLRKVSAQFDTLVVTLIGFVGGLILTIPAAGIELTQKTIGTIDAGVILGILYLGIVSTAVAMWLWSRAFALVDASTASLFFFAQPVVGVLLSAMFGRAITESLIVGGVLIAAGVLMSIYPLERLVSVRAPIETKL